MDKSFVSMGLCPICHEENGQILMDRRIKNTLEPKTLTLDPCDTCKKEVLPKNVLFFIKASEQDKQIMGRIVIPDKLFADIFTGQPIPPKKIAFCDLETAEKLKSIIDQIMAKQTA